MHGLHLLRGIVTRIGATDIDVAVPQKDVHLLVRATGPGHPFRGSKGISVAEKKSTFRLDKDEYGDTCKLLHRNLVDFFVSVSVSLASLQSAVDHAQLTPACLLAFGPTGHPCSLSGQRAIRGCLWGDGVRRSS